MKTHRSLVKLAEELGVQTDIRYAQTGTVYVAFERKGRSTKSTAIHAKKPNAKRKSCLSEAM